MRFLADGPSIPDELLIARDQGRVIFFCGAGVSRARANLPDFFGLAQRVVSKLGVDSNSPACRLIEEAKEFDRRVGIPGVISADRVFGLLERDFSAKDIEEAVALALKPPEDCDLTAHSILLDLATTPKGSVQLVTTNFDRLFDDCGRNLKAWQPPKLPDPRRPSEINGIVYLHGRAKADYTGAEGDGFILSSSEFGRAYLSDGWAKTFIREILERYVVVFIGYTADDPPVHYLLEALRNSRGTRDKAYAFQAGAENDAISKWIHKGVEAIPYLEENYHSALWETLDAWAERARDPDIWQDKVIQMSQGGPAKLQPHERGQVAHIVSTFEGAKRFCVSKSPPPAEWLCVFDKHRRFEKPGTSGSPGQNGRYVDPFDIYGIDSDPSPNKDDPEDHYAKREVPAYSWDAFEISRLDRTAIRDDNLPALRGPFSSQSPHLVQRVGQLGAWLARVHDHSAAIWWAAHQTALHPTVQQMISWELERGDRQAHPRVRKIWRQILEAWNRNSDFHLAWHSLVNTIKTDGWSSAAVRRLGDLLSPHLSVEPSMWSRPVPPRSRKEGEIDSGIINLNVKYPELQKEIVIPDEWAAACTKALKRNLELSIALEREIGGYGLSNISPIAQGEVEDSDYHKDYGLSAAVIRFARIFSQLSIFDIKSARNEYLSWPKDDNTVFSRLRIWASGDRRIVRDHEFSSVIQSLSNTAFWDSHHQRDLLLVISARWKRLNKASRGAIEDRILKGPKRLRRERAEDYIIRKSWSTVERIYWLKQAGCNLSTSAKAEMDRLRISIPNWTEELGARAADSLQGRGGWVRTDTSHSILENIPVSEILSKAKEYSGRSNDFLVENDPFAGLVSARPARSLAALIYAARNDEFPVWAWRQFLSHDTRKEDRARLTLVIAERLLQQPNSKLASILRPSIDWLKNASMKVEPKCIPVLYKLLDKQLTILHHHPETGQSGILRGSRAPDWTMESINSPVGKLAECLFNDSRIFSMKKSEGLPSEWISSAERLLSLPGNLRRYSLVIFLHHLEWIYHVDKSWAEKQLITALESSSKDDHDAAWSGFLWAAKTPNRDLYTRLKASMLALSKSRPSNRRQYTEIIAGMILAGWATADATTGTRLISDDELRSLLVATDDEFRSQVLWLARKWSNARSQGQYKHWQKQLHDLLDIWPRHLSARSPNISARLCEVAFASGEHFPTISTKILPILGRVDRFNLIIPDIRNNGNTVFDKYPQQALAILYSALPTDAIAWPYGIDEVLQRIEQADSSLRTDERLISLKQQWDSR